jgi:hypothetical protein
MLALFIIALVSGLITGAIFDHKGRSAGSGFALGFLVPVVGLVIALVVSATPERSAANAVASGTGKKCPQCAEVVPSEARVCRFCKHEFNEAHRQPVGELERECPSCHRRVFHTAKRCAFCRTSFAEAR